LRLCAGTLIGALAWSAGLPATRSQAIDPAAATAACSIARKHRVYVGMADGVDLDDYERAAGEAHSIMSLVKAGLCTPGRGGSQQLLTPSLRSALEAGRRVQLAEVQFDDVALAHAHVLLRSNATSGSTTIDGAWRVHVHRDAAWQIDTVRDEPSVRR
jgi:hypothetical protein